MSELAANLTRRMTPMREAGRFPPEHLEAFAKWVEDAPDEALYRTNPYHYAEAHGLQPHEAIDLFVHAARAGIFDFVWGLVCPRCTAFISTKGGLKSLERERECAMCEVRAGSNIDDWVEVTFSVNPAVRRTRFQGTWLEVGSSPQQLADDSGRLYFSSLSALGDGIRTMIAQRTRALKVIRRGQSVQLSLDSSEAGTWRLLVPSVHAVCKVTSDPAGVSEATIEIMDGLTIPAEVQVKPGPVTLTVVNRTEETELIATIICLESDDRPDDGSEDDTADGDESEDDEQTPPFLSGKQILSTQSFRELFRTETLSPDATLEIRNLTFLFTDLKASTQLYEQVGDLAALAMVRSHFGVLREVIARRGGAVVKTIGDAVMATFVDSRDAVAAGVEMHHRLREAEEARTLELKVGIHTGPCVAIDSNERLDYFGQTVNVAARVQALAEGRELVCTDDVLHESGVSAVLAEMKVTAKPEEAHLKGVSQAIRVHRATVV